MKKIVAYMAAMVLAFACTKAPESIIPHEEEIPSTPQEGPRLTAIYVTDSSISLEPGGNATLHFRVEDPDCQFGELLLDGLGPLAHEHDELVNSPCYSATFALLDVRGLM